jgi:N-acetylglutamate synthase-like GNAT family acetyltransferase
VTLPASRKNKQHNLKMTNQFYISTDKSKLNKELIFDFLTNNSYWAKGRSRETVYKSIENSLCFGIYSNDKQVGFARVVTDYSTFAWILDLFILSEYRKNGLGKMIMNEIMNHNQLQNLQRWGLNTYDAQSLYEKYGFKTIEKPEIHMELTSKPF